MLEARLSERVIGCAISVHRELGCGFLERVYERALAVELTQSGLRFAQQAPLTVRYKGAIVGDYTCDFLVEGTLIVEIKALRSLSAEHESQVLNYLRAGQCSVGLLLNFGATRLGIRRLVHAYDDTDSI